jgi:23S rRNA (adenine2503-C2)-methyltransferase
MVQRNIRHLTITEIREHLVKAGEKPFRANQVWSWLWQKHASGFGEMSNLPANLRTALEQEFTLPALRTDTVQVSSDGTVKSRFLLQDGNKVEGVLIPSRERTTACISSQVGCSLGCRFCATGYMEKQRNLEFDEIYDEAALINLQSLERHQHKLTNIVFMGMGEPLLNYGNVIRAIDRIAAPDGLAMSPRRITVSTAGIAKMIRKLGDDKVRFNLALSLHAANDEKRSGIMPINDSNNLTSLMDALNHFYALTKNEITFEYILFRDINDSRADADQLVRLYRKVPVKVVNLIEYNSIDQADFAKPGAEKIQEFMDYLHSQRVNVRLRRSRGKDIDAACGQLANK